jgi:hypothetical protein
LFCCRGKHGIEMLLGSCQKIRQIRESVKIDQWVYMLCWLRCGRIRCPRLFKVVVKVVKVIVGASLCALFKVVKVVAEAIVAVVGFFFLLRVVYWPVNDL